MSALFCSAGRAQAGLLGLQTDSMTSYARRHRLCFISKIICISPSMFLQNIWKWLFRRLFHQGEAGKDVCMWANVASHLKQKGIKQGYVFPSCSMFLWPLILRILRSPLMLYASMVLKTAHNWLLHFKTETNYFACLLFWGTNFRKKDVKTI